MSFLALTIAFEKVEKSSGLQVCRVCTGEKGMLVNRAAVFGWLSAGRYSLRFDNLVVENTIPTD